MGREAPDRARRTESGGDRQKPPPLCCSDGRSLGDRFQIRIQPVASAGNASAKAVAARRYPTVEHKGARARQSRARKLAVQKCRDCKLRQLRRISLTASWGTSLWCRRWRQSVVSAESGGCAALSGAAGRQRLVTEGGATILKVWSFQYLVLLQRLAQRGGRGRTGRHLRIAQSTACGSPCAIAVERSVQGKRIMLHRHREYR